MNEHSRKALPEPAQGGTAGVVAPDASALDARIRGLLSDRGAARSSPLAAALGAPLRTVQDRLGRLARQGDVTQPKRGTWELTAAGRRAALTAQVPALAPLDLPGVLAALPPWHAAMVRLALGAAVARRALAAQYPSNWLSLIAIGRTKTGKTLIGWIVCWLLGLDPVAQVRLLSFETAGSVGIRRSQRRGGAFGGELAAMLRQPFALFDELDKAPPEVRRSVGAVLLGQSAIEVEGTRLEVLATPMVTLNDDRGRALLSEAHLRRAVVLNTRAPAVRAATRVLDDVAHHLERAVICPVAPDLAPPAASLPERARQLLRAVLVGCLTDLGFERVDVEPLARTALGYWALDVDAGPELAAARVALDYLLCTSTCEGELRDDWDRRFAAAAGSRTDDAQLRGALAAVSGQHDAARVARQAELAQDADAQLALAARRAELLAIIDAAVRGAPRALAASERPLVAAAKAKASILSDWTRRAASLEDLVALAPRIETEVVAPLRRIAEARDAAAERARQTRAATERQRTEAREQAKQVNRSIARLQRLYRRVRTKPSEDVLAELLRLGCVTERSETYVVEIPPSLLERAGDFTRSLWNSVPSAPAAPPAPPNDPYSLGGGFYVALPRSLSATATPEQAKRAPRYADRVRTWYEDAAQRSYAGSELREWPSPVTKAVLQTAAGRYGRRLNER